VASIPKHAEESGERLRAVEGRRLLCGRPSITIRACGIRRAGSSAVRDAGSASLLVHDVQKMIHRKIKGKSSLTCPPGFNPEILAKYK
jgi:hypothetical protein